MAIFSTTKRVSDPLNEEAKARLLWHVGGNVDGDSPRLCELVQSFLEDNSDDGLHIFFDSDDSDLSKSSTMECSGVASEEIVKRAASCSDSDIYRNLLLGHVLRAVEAYYGLRSRNKSVFLEKVASFLRELGHDTAVCVSKWSSSAKLTAGSYDFIDVVYKPSDDDRTAAVRYFVDLDFASEFEIARPTGQYARVLQLLPRVFVGKEKNLRTLVKELCEVAKQSMKSRGLSLPPWRRSFYLQHKWFGPYKRKGVGSLNSDAVSCRFIGFGDGAINTRLFIKT